MFRGLFGWRRGVFILAPIAVLLGLYPGGAVAGQCLKDHRDAQLKPGAVVRLREYFCRSTDGSASIRVQFHRLSDAAASVLLGQQSVRWFHNIFGSNRLVTNDVTREFRSLLSRFGTHHRSQDYGGETALVFSVETPPGGAGADPSDIVGEQFVLTLLPGGTDLPWLKGIVQIRDQERWPAGFRFFYYQHPGLENLIATTAIWRFATSSDISTFAHRQQEFNARVGSTNPYLKPSKYIAMIEHITKAGMPHDFLVVRADTRVCGDAGFAFWLGGRSLMLDVVVLENASDQPVLLEGMVGSQTSTGNLRPMLPGRKSAPATPAVIASPHRLEPGARLVIPIRIFARATLGEWLKEESLANANQIYHAVRNSHPGHMFYSDLGTDARGRSVIVSKLKESFGPPSMPSGPNYVYGPELSITGLVVNGERMELEGTSANFLNMTAEARAGSCPILYTWSDTDRLWYRYGKVIHEARSWPRQATEHVRLKGLATRFRIAEEELELASIDQVRLSLELTNGQEVELLPGLEALNAIDGQYARLYTGDHIDLVFSLPDDVQSADVVNSTLSVTGYYDRYESLLYTASPSSRK